MTLSNLYSALAATLVISTVGCATDVTTVAPVDEAAPHELEQLATVTSYTGTTVELYRSGKGFLAVEYGAKELPRALDFSAELTLAETYRTATHKAELPANVAAAAAEIEAFDIAHGRAVSHAPLEVERMSTAADLPALALQPKQAAGSCSASFMQSQNDCKPGPGYDWSLINWWNGAYEYINGVDYSSAILCADIGDIVWEINNGDGGHHTWTVLEGQLWSYGLSDGGGTWLHYDVTHATNNRFHFCGWAI